MGKRVKRDSAFGEIWERPPDVVRNPDGSLTFNRIPQTVTEAVEMTLKMVADDE